MNPDEWTNFFLCALRFTVEVDAQVVFDIVLDPRRKFEDRRWVWTDLALTAGRHSIAFVTSTDNPFCALPRTAGWARPRLVLPYPAAQAPPPGG
jgi:hypothetical protein